MSFDTDTIQIIVDARTDEANMLQASLNTLETELKRLKAAMDAGRISQAQFASGFRQIDSEIQQTQNKLQGLEQSISRVGGKLQGASRASAKFQIGLAGANIAQDVIQGGPAAGINNILGLAGSNGVRALVGESVAAAGGIAAIGTAFATVAVAAGAAFLAINKGLSDAKLEWSDFGDVVANTHAFTAASEAASGFTTIVTESGIAQKIMEWGPALHPMVGQLKLGWEIIDKYAIGWNQATDAVKTHKAEVEGAVVAAKQYAEATKTLGKFKSDEQEEAEKRGKLVGGAVAKMEPGGINEVLDKLAANATRAGGDRKIKIQEVGQDADGKATTREVEVTRREAAKRRLATELAKATNGDASAQDRFRTELKGAGYDPKEFDFAAAGRDRDKERKESREAGEKGEKEAEAKKKQEEEQAARNFDRRSDQLASPLQERFNLAKAKGANFDVRGELIRGGTSKDEVDAEGFDKSVGEKLDDGYAEAMRKRAGEKGLTTDEAARDLVKEDEDKKAQKAQQEEAKREQAREKAGREADQLHKVNLDRAEKGAAGTGLDARAEDATLRSALAGGSKESILKRVEDQLAKEFEANGQDASSARDAARQKAEETYGKVGDEVARGAFGPGGQAEQARPVERIGVADFARSVESAGQDTAKKQLTVSEAMKTQLEELVRLGRSPGRVG